MFEIIRAAVLRWMRVPHDPAPPAGAPDSVRVFRAGENFYKFQLLGWILTQLVGVAAIVFWIVMLGLFERNVVAARQARDLKAQSARSASLAPTDTTIAPLATVPTSASPVLTSPEKTSTKAEKGRPRRTRTEQFARVPMGLVWLLRSLEVLSIVGFLAQLPITLAALRLDFEMRWYIVTDRSLRIRSGIWRVQEMTMSFANIQQVAVTRGPIQGLLKISDLRVQSAGGGGGDSREGRRDTLHTGIFHGVSNASEIRDLILERLRIFRTTGLGDPDDHTHVVETSSRHGDSMQSAARELLAEARALRTAV